MRNEGRDERDRMDALPDGCNWYVVKTNPRCEARATASIRAEGFTVYAPMLLREYRHKRRKCWIEREFVLFVGYLFVALPDPEAVGKIKGCDGVRGILKGAKGPFPIPAGSVAQLQAAQRAGQFDRLRPKTEHGYVEEDRVLIAKGTFTDFVGTVTDASKADLIRVATILFNAVHEFEVPVDNIRHAA